MLNYAAPAGNTAEPDAHDAEQAAGAKAFYLLTRPVSIDAGVIAVAITQGANHAQTLKSDLIQFEATVIGSAVIATALLLGYRYAGRVSGWLGNMGLEVMLRLSALLVLSIGVQIVWNRVKSLLGKLRVA